MAVNFFESLAKGDVEFDVSDTAICDKHGEYQWQHIKYSNGLESKPFCPLCDKEQADIQFEKEKEKQREKQIEKYKAGNIEKEYWDKEFSDYKAENESQEKALNSVKRIVENKSGKLILLGTNGIGKTMLASIAVKHLGGKILSMYEISTMIRQSYTTRAEKTELEIVQELASIPFLGIDELGRTKGSDAELNWLSYVLDKRHVRGLPFMIMSNTHLKSRCPDGGCSMCFENYLNSDILSRLRQDTTLINVEGSDFRANRKK